MEVVKALLDLKVDINQPNRRLQIPLFLAPLHFQSRLCLLGASLLGSPLNDAIDNRNIDLALQLIEAKACVNMRCQNGNNSVSYAAEAGDEKLIRALHAARADFNAPNNDGFTPLHHAKPQLQSIMRELGASLHGSQLNDALEQDDHARAMQLLHAKADPHARSPRSFRQAIHVAAQRSNEEMVRALVAMGADVNKQTRRGQRPIDLAPISFRATLRELGASINGSALNDALVAREHNLALQLLEEGKVDLHARDRIGCLCTHFACIADFPDILTTLVERGVAVNERTYSGNQVDAYARHKLMKATIAELRNRGARQQELSMFGSQLNGAVFNRDSELAIKLLLSGADPHAECATNGK